MRALIVDDEAPARQRLRRMLEALSVEVVGEAGNGLEALEKTAALSPDVLFLDIEMPELDGFGVAASLNPESRPAIIFVTAFDEHALQAFDSAAVDYLVKPVAQARLEAAIRKASPKSIELPRPPRLAVRSGTRFAVFDPAQVSAVIARDHYSAILVGGRELLADDSLDEVARRLDPALFMRVHRSAIINLNFLKELEREGDRKYSAVLSDGKRVPVSRDRLDLLKERLGL